MLDLERDDKNYLVALDYHDDVVVFDSEEAPTKADFYQIKTSTAKKWNLTRLLGRKEGTLSILGKLHSHRISFSDKASSLNFVSNQIFSLPVDEMKTLKDVENLRLSELCSEALIKIAKSLKAEHQLHDLPTAEIEIVFKMDSMGPKEHELFAEGKFSKYLSDTYGDRPYIVSNAFRAIMDFIKRRNNYEGVISSEADLINKKAVRKTDFRSMIARSGRIGDNQTWASIEAALIKDGFGVGKIRKYQSFWRSREIELLEYSNSIVQDSQEVSDAVVAEVIEENEDATVVQVIDESCLRLKTRLETFPVPFDKNQLLSAVLTSLVHKMQ